jgi:serine protease Do
MDNDERLVFIHEARIILLTVIFTVTIGAVLLYTFRTELIGYLFNQLSPEFAEMIPPEKVHTSNEDRVISAIATVNPAVVSVIVTKDVPVYEQYYETLNPWGLFGGFSVPRIRERGTEEREVGGGSGFIVSSDGLIVTNRHVVEDEEARYSVVLSDGTVYSVRVVDRDPQLDIAILEITELPNAKLPFVVFGDSEKLQLGQTVIAIGNALAEFQNTVSLGVVSGLGRSIIASDLMGNSEQLNQVIQTDAAINPGNSGGPLLTLDGKVVGVNVATSRGADNIGFALPAHIVQQVVTSVQEYGEIVRPLLGVRYVMIDETLQSENELEQSYGALIIAGADGMPGVAVGSPADEAGLQEGDIISAIDGVTLINRDLATELRNKSVGQTIELKIVRDGEPKTVVATLVRAL